MMKLACQRCKRKKIKCDRAHPVCHQCITAKAECLYVERRQRPRLAQQKVAVQHLNQRLEQLERQMNNNSHKEERSPVPSRSSTARDITPVPSPKASLTTSDGQDSWIYRLATDTRRNFQTQTTPVNTPTPRMDDAMLSLNEALEDLGKIRLRGDSSKADLNLTPQESKECMDAFTQLMQKMVVPDVFTDALDFDLLNALPNIIDSPYVNVEPGVHVMYYNAMYYGLQQTRGPGDPLSRVAYMKAIDHVPAWLETSSGTEMDGHTAALMSWTAIINFDYLLSWKFHCKSCQYIKLNGFDQIDVVPARTFEEDAKREKHRFLYWHILSTDSLFRLFYGKPTVVRYEPNRVKPPALFSPANMHPTAFQVTVAVVWVRYTLLTAEMVNYLDDNGATDSSEVIARTVDKFCFELESLIVEFKLESIMDDEDNPTDFRSLVADHIMNVYAIIIGAKRQVNNTRPEQLVDEITIRAARKIVEIIVDYNADPNVPEEEKSMSDHFITFYPFCAVFSLYEHVFACDDPDDCERDIKSLEDIAVTMAKICNQRRGFVPFVKTINAMNRVVRSFQDERRKTWTGEIADPATPNSNLPPSNLDNIQSIVANELDHFDPATFHSMPDFPMTMDGDMNPLGFVRALENDFQSRAWHDNWWDFNSGARGPMVDENGNIQAAPFSLPTPNTQ